MDYGHEPSESPPSFWRTRYGMGCLVLGSVATYFILTEHLAHTVSALPYLLFAACPLMHIFMHGGHGHGHQDHSDRKDKSLSPSTQDSGKEGQS